MPEELIYKTGENGFIDKKSCALGLDCVKQIKY
jgi:hypothetical protein